MLKHYKTLKLVSYSLAVIFILLIGSFLIPESIISKRASLQFAAVLGLIFLILGIFLIYLTLKLKVKGKLKKFLILTGISAIGPLVFSILHNLFYALEVISNNIAVLKYLMGFLHVASFLIALLISPVGFLIGVIGSIILLKKRKLD